MSDRVAESTLAVDVTGEEAINRLTAALDRLQQSAVNVQRTVSAAGTQAAGASASAQIASVTQQATGEAGSLGVKLGEAFGRAIGTSIRAPFDALKSTAEIAGRSLMGFAGPLGEIAGKTGPAAAAVVGLTAAVTGLAVPIANLIAGFKLLQDSFGWAKDAAEEQLRVAARTRRFMPGVMGEGVEAAEQEMRARMGVMTSLFGSAAESMQQNVTRRFTEYRLGKGLRGEADIFERWGITPEAIQRMEQTGQRVDLNEWLRMFILKREELEQQLQRPGISAEERAGVEKRLGMFADDTTKMFNQKFSDMALAMGSADVDRLKANLEAALPIGHVEGATQKAINFTIALESLKATFGELTFGIGGDVQPAITQFLETINTKLTQADSTGRSVASALRELASSMATNAWQVLKSIMDQIDVPRINSWLEAIKSWQPAETATTVKSLITGVINFGSAIWELIQAVNQLMAALPDWLKAGPGGAQNPLTAAFESATGARLGPGGGIAGMFGGGGGGGAGGGGAGIGGLPGEAGIGAPATAVAAQAAGIPSALTPNAPPPGAGAAPQVAATAGLGAAPVSAAAPAAPAQGAPMPAPATAAAGAPAAPAQQPAGPEQQQGQGLLGRIGSGIKGAFSMGQPAAPQAPAPGPPPAASQGAAAPGIPSPGPTAPAGGPVPAAAAGRTVAGQRDVWGGFGGAQAAAAPAPVTAAPGPPPQPPQGPAAGSDRYGLPGLTAPRVGKPQWDAEQAFKGAAAGRAMSLMTDVEHTPTGPELIMRATGQRPETERGMRWGGEAAGSDAESQQQALLSRQEARAGGRALTETAPWLGMEAQRETLTTPPTMQDRWTGGITAQDGAAFGTAAGEQIRDQLQGVNIPYGPASTSYGVSPRSAPKPTGGDTATEA